MNALPIFDSRDGRTVIGHANGLRGAIVAIRRLITVPQRGRLIVWQRSKADIDMRDLLDVPDGFCYAISFG